MKKVDIFTDGACSGNPGPGGWGAILRYEGHEKELSGGEKETTNNRMELTAVISALKALKEVYEERIKDIKQSSVEHIQSLKRDKKILIIAICILSSLLLGALLFDLFLGSMGWLRF